MAIHVRNNFCIAPFTQITLSPVGGYSPCPEIGGRPWTEPTANPCKMWLSEEFQELRQSFTNNEKNTICNRCWDQEKFQDQSLRRRLFTNNKVKLSKPDLLNILDGQYVNGPRQINIIVGNKCNLRCRICRAGSSVTYNIEGEYYMKKNNLDAKSAAFYVSSQKKPIEFSEEQIDQLFSISANLQRIEFYGGEPLLDTMTLKLLKKLIESGQSKNITLFYNTNGTNNPKAHHYELWNQFKSLEFNISIDDIEHRFTYNRHPGIWEDLLKTVADLKTYPWKIPMDIFAITTISSLNIYYLPELLDKLDNINLSVFLNTVHGPPYYEIIHLPVVVKQKIKEKLITYKDRPKIQFLLNMLDQPENLTHWENFKFWTKEKDLYRGEKFSETYPEFFKVLTEYDPTFI